MGAGVADFVFLFYRGGGQWAGWDAAGEGRVIVDVEFEEVKEGVGDKVYRTVDFCWKKQKCELELKRRAGSSIVYLSQRRRTALTVVLSRCKWEMVCTAADRLHL